VRRRAGGPGLAVAAAAVVLAALAASGCLESPPPPGQGYVSDDAGFDPPPAPDGGSTAGDSDATVPGCALDAGAASDGGGFDGGASEGGTVAAWAGTWAFTSGSQGLACGGSLSVVAVSGFLDITPSNSGTLLTVVEDGCTFHFDLACETATSEPDQSCAAWAVPTIPDWTLTMQPDGTLHEKLAGRVAVGGDVCTISGSSTLVRQ
jgi:hypothetical protein